ncbi:MAG TPA: hypothetical protein DCP79_01795 [Prevotella sp.]|nr:hypothetical protein [Prevotella sp.]
MKYKHPKSSRRQTLIIGVYLLLSCLPTSLNNGPLSGIYCATKHAVKAISETLAQEVTQFGIRATDVKPGFILYTSTL